MMVAVGVSLYKSGRNQPIENYRAISLLVACSKILEKVVTNQFLEYFRRNNYLTSRQFGYMQNVSTGDAVVDIVDILYNCFDAGETALGVFLDLSKAFDTLNREILFAKLQYYGVGENALAF